MAEAAVLNIVLQKGADYNITGQWLDNLKNNIDISAATIRAEVREFDDGPLIATFTFVIFLAVVGTETKWFYSRKMAQTIINTISITEGVWDQFIELSDGSSTKLLQGKVKITGNITEPTV